ncbi:ROK family protein [Demequina aurantiaca]|uniref:ROK family protein n=1 Tax=Demequina aurantiaca TaxID=676200 RepID=UPI001F3DD804|nr:ROK family protein [Demequina aurantiaca]
MGVDIGGTKTDVVVTDASGTVSQRHRVPSGQGNDAVVAATLEAVAYVCAEADIGIADVESVGIGVPGAVIDGVVTHAYNLGVERLDVATTLGEAWGITPVVDNDVNAAAVGAWILTGNGNRSMAFLNLGTGLAAGIVLDGKVWRGRRGAAGEIGHIAIDPSGPLDAEGTPGAIETYASGSGIVRQWGGNTTAEEVLRAATLGDPAAEIIRDRLFYGIASAVRVLVLTLDVDEVILGGGLTKWGEPLMTGTLAVLNEWQERSAFLNSLCLSERVQALDSTEPVAAVGAAMMGAGRG